MENERTQEYPKLDHWAMVDQEIQFLPRDRIIDEDEIAFEGASFDEDARNALEDNRLEPKSKEKDPFEIRKLADSVPTFEDI